MKAWWTGLVKLFIGYLIFLFIQQIILVIVADGFRMDRISWNEGITPVQGVQRKQKLIFARELDFNRNKNITFVQRLASKTSDHKHENTSLPKEHDKDGNISLNQISGINKKMQLDNATDIHKEHSIKIQQHSINSVPNVTRFNYTSNEWHKFDNSSLKTYEPVLYKKLYEWFIKQNCTLTEPNIDYSNLILYQPKMNKTQGAKTILFTTLYADKSKQYLFMNTLRNWSRLRPYIQTVLFLSDLQTLEQSGILIYTAFKNDWIIAAVPQCFKSYPLLSSMYRLVHKTFPDMTWYMYANGDILFTENLGKILNELDKVNKKHELKNKELPFTFATGRRKNIFIEYGRLVSMEDLRQFEDSTDFHNDFAIDYFIYYKTSPMLDNMPPFAVARKGYDNWLVYNAICKTNGSVDISHVNSAIHIGIEGKTLLENSSRIKRKYVNYNVHLKEVLNAAPLYLSTGGVTRMLYVIRRQNKQDFKVYRKTFKPKCINRNRQT